MTSSGEEQFNELSFYTLAHSGITFIHQHIVDAKIAQTADISTKPISIVFSLVGLYLCVEKNYTGRQVQQIHMQMVKIKNSLPDIMLPERRGAITISDVLASRPGNARDEMIHKWCASVWEAYQDSREKIMSVTQKFIRNK